MSEELAKLKVVLEADKSPLRKTMQEARNEIKRTTDSISREVDKARSPFSKLNPEIRKVLDSCKKMRAEFRKKAGFPEEGLGNAIKNSFSDKLKKAQINAGLKEYTEEYNQARSDMERSEKTLERLKQKMRDLDASGVSRQSAEFKKLVDQIDRAKRQVDGYNGKILRMKALGEDVKFSGFKNITGGILSKTFSGMKAVFSAIGAPAIKIASGAFAALIQRFISGIPFINKTKSSFNGLGRSGKGLSGILRTLGTSAKFMLASFLIRGSLNGAKEGFENLAQYSERTNSSISMLMSSLTQLKNALAAAFAPILNVVAPILDFIIQKIISVVNAIGQLTSALTGNGSYIRAKKVNQDYAASLSQTSKGAEKAQKANEKLKKTLLGFDQIHKMDDNSDSDSGTSGGLSPSDMFENQGIESSISDFAKRIKDAWEKADFTEIGTIVGNKLNDALNRIPWSKIKETSRRIARSIATFLNGFIKSADWKLIGNAFAQGLNTVIEFGHTFFNTFDWKSFGKSLSDGVNGFVQNFEWKTAAEALSAKIKGILDTANAFIENTDWWNLGEQIWSFVKNVDWTGITERLAESIGAAIGGLFALIGGFLEDAWGKLAEWWHKTAYKDGKFSIKGLLNGILDTLASIGSWIYEHIFQPFITGFKRAFGINSPSTVMAEQGHYIVEGLYKGVLDKIDKVLQWFGKLPERVKTAIGDISEKVKSKGKDIVSGIKSGYESTKDRIRTAVSGIPGLIKSGMGNIWDVGRNAIKSFIDGFKSLSIPTPHFETNGTYSIAGINTPIPKVKVRWYASGGFPDTGEMFVARENGPELVGRMGNRSAVANNGQIIEGIKAGVFEAVMDAFTAAGQFFGSVGEKQVVLELTLMCDSETAYRIVRKGKQKYEGRYSIIETI